MHHVDEGCFGECWKDDVRDCAENVEDADGCGECFTDVIGIERVHSTILNLQFLIFNYSILAEERAEFWESGANGEITAPVFESIDAAGADGGKKAKDRDKDDMLIHNEVIGIRIGELQTGQIVEEHKE